MLNTRQQSEQSDLAKTVPDFWTLLGLFFDKERVNDWKRKIFPNSETPSTGVEGCFNLICLAFNVHDLWNKGGFALKPLKLSDDGTESTVQFFWQPSKNFKVDARVDILSEPISSQFLKAAGDEALAFPRREGGGVYLPITSGDTFTFTTKDPERLPLPSMELLEMQWYLHRLIGMCGVATLLELDLNDDGDDFIPGAEDIYNWIPPPPPELERSFM